LTKPDQEKQPKPRPNRLESNKPNSDPGQTEIKIIVDEDWIVSEFLLPKEKRKSVTADQKIGKE
jgi:hypothetical protein